MENQSTREIFLKQVGNLVEAFEAAHFEAKKRAWDEGYNASVGDQINQGERSRNPYTF